MYIIIHVAREVTCESGYQNHGTLEIVCVLLLPPTVVRVVRVWTSDCWPAWCRTCGTSSVASADSCWTDSGTRRRPCGCCSTSSGPTDSKTSVRWGGSSLFLPPSHFLSSSLFHSSTIPPSLSASSFSCLLPHTSHYETLYFYPISTYIILSITYYSVTC